MKRSRINQAIKRIEEMAKAHGFHLPPFCNYTPEEWADRNSDYNEIRDNMLGWDITDYGMGDFEKLGFSLVTIRNGNIKDERYPKPYAEKLLMIEDGQYAPMHFHWSKMEDIINRGGGNVLIRVYNYTPEGQFADTDVKVCQDGYTHYVPAGTQVRLTPGESITIYPYLYHDFSVEAGTGAVLLGEVSMCNDDENDNRFYEKLGRFPAIEEDEPAYRLLCSEYPKAKG
jgi:D-lyxose ketol-isomerase